MNLTIFKQGDPVRNIYVIKTGEITIWKRIKIKKKEKSTAFQSD